MHVVATAGHVDHGKSTLVLHLTGTDPDRLAEEKERGLTIDLGFASVRLPSGAEAAVVDVPGHVRFLKNMLAGVGAVDACLFVVAATEGWKPQSEEHLRILELLGLAHGVVALTKVGLADDELVELAQLEIEEHLEGTFLADAPIVPVDAPTGVGLDDLRRALDDCLADTPRAVDRGRPRLWVDRSFAPVGAGTVVTGTLTGGPIAVDDLLTVVPGDIEVRVRSLQQHGRTVDSLPPGVRAAVNLVGVGHDDVGRGHALVIGDQWHRATVVDAAIRILDAAERPLSRRGAHVAYLGAGEFPVRVRVLGPDVVEPGDEGFVRLWLPRPLPLLPGDRFILRDAGPGRTVGGGEILDVAPVRRAADAAPDRSVDRVVAERGWVDVDDLERLTGERRSPDVGSWAVAPEALDATVAALQERVDQAGPLGLDLAAVDDRARAVIDRLEGVVAQGGNLVREDAIDPLDGHPWLDALAAEPFSPPGPPDDVGRTEVRELVRRGVVVELDGIAFAPSAVEEAAQLVAGLLARQPDGFTVAEVRDLWGTSRKFALALLGHLDATGQTRRRDDVRIAGPRLPAPQD